MFIKLSKVAKMLDLHKDTLRRYIRRGILEGKQLPTGHWRVEEASIHALLNKTIDSEVDELLDSL